MGGAAALGAAGPWMGLPLRRPSVPARNCSPPGPCGLVPAPQNVLSRIAHVEYTIPGTMSAELQDLLG